MIKKLTIALGTIAVIAVGATMFAGFESHLIDVRAHVEKATFVKPDDLNFGITIMQQKYDAECILPGDPNNANGKCMSIHLSDSFKEQIQFVDVTYTIYCEDKDPTDPHRVGPPPLDGNITPFIQLRDSDPLDVNDAVDKPAGTGCGTVAYGTPFSLTANRWAHGELVKGSDEVDLWDMSFYAPVCRDNYNPDTDPLSPSDLAGRPGGGIIETSFCHKGPGPDSDEYTNLGSNVKFQVVGLSVPTP